MAQIWVASATKKRRFRRPVEKGPQGREGVPLHFHIAAMHHARH
jgi:hypothetical protein